MLASAATERRFSSAAGSCEGEEARAVAARPRRETRERREKSMANEGLGSG